MIMRPRFCLWKVWGRQSDARPKLSLSPPRLQCADSGPPQPPLKGNHAILLRMIRDSDVCQTSALCLATTQKLGSLLRTHPHPAPPPFPGATNLPKVPLPGETDPAGISRSSLKLPFSHQTDPALGVLGSGSGAREHSRAARSDAGPVASSCPGAIRGPLAAPPTGQAWCSEPRPPAPSPAPPSGP